MSASHFVDPSHDDLELVDFVEKVTQCELCHCADLSQSDIMFECVKQVI